MAVILPAGWTGFNSGCCSDTTERGQRVLVEELRFTNFSANPGNDRTSWSYVSPEEEIFTLVGDAGCGGGNMTYGDLCCRINHFTGPGTPADHPALISVDGFPAVNTVMGVSDEPCYTFTNSAYRRAFFPESNTAVNLDSPPFQNPFGNFFTFAKRGDKFYGFNAILGGGDASSHRVWAWDLPSGAFLWESLDITEYFAHNAAATDNFIYTLIARASGVSTPIKAIAKLDKDDGSLLATFSLDDISPQVLFTVSDNLIYILTSTGAFYYLKNFTTLVFVGRFVTSIGPFVGTGFFTNNRFYYGGTGFGGFSTQIYSVEMPCPESEPLIATVTTVTNTVAAGANIVVNWDDVLEPHVTDRLYLKANDGTLFDPTPLSNQTPIAAGASDGTHNFTIPGGTTPGSYVIQFVAKNNYYVASTAPFTVT